MFVKISVVVVEVCVVVVDFYVVVVEVGVVEFVVSFVVDVRVFVGLLFIDSHHLAVSNDKVVLCCWPVVFETQGLVFSSAFVT